MNFVFNDQESYASAFYSIPTDTVTLNFRYILKCDKMTDDEKIRVMTWQIEHETLHSLIYKSAGESATTDFDNICWAINDKREFLELYGILKKAGFKYNGRCKYLGRE